MRSHSISFWPLFFIVAFLSAGPSAHGAGNAPKAEVLAEAALDGLAGTSAAGTLQGNDIRIAVRGELKAKGGEPIFEIGSVSKVFTGLLLAQAVESKDLSLNDTVGELLATSVRFESKRAASITLRQLVTHTSCLPLMPENPNMIPAASQITSYSRADLWRALGNASLPRQSSCEASYSNFGMAVLAELLSQRAGRPWEELVRARITEPLGMRDTFAKAPEGRAPRLVDGYVRNVPVSRWETDAFAGAGGLRSTATDLLIFSKALLMGKQGPLGPAAERFVTGLSSYGKSNSRIGYAVILPASPSPAWVHNGITGGQVAEWIVWPDRREAVVILVSNLASNARGIARSLIATTK